MSNMDVTLASPTRGRRSLDAPTAAGAELVATDSYEAGATALVAELREDSVAMPRAELSSNLRLAEATGMIAAFQYNEASNRLAMLKSFQQIRDSKAYRGATVVSRRTGETMIVATWDDFCAAHGFSKRKIDEDLQNLATFGGDLLELQDKLGLGYRDLRLLRKGLNQLPPEERQAVLDDVAKAEGPDELKERLEDLRLELARAKARAQTLQEDLDAKEAVSRKKTDKLDRLEEQVAKLTSIRPDDKTQIKLQRNKVALGDLDAACREVEQAVTALCAQAAAIFADDAASEASCMQVHRRVSILAEYMADVIARSGIDVDLAAHLQPEMPAPDADAGE